jgi:ribulose kinase
MLAAAAVGWYTDCGQAAAAMSTMGKRFIPDDKTQRYYERIYSEVYVSLFPAIRSLIDKLTAITRAQREQG